ncbi:MlaD family protein [Chelatococcus sp. SYSU_G07232]|uniref:MlaD family protein n=1 Tax=Chelatococcus albus TaxID=3047466 RepID=A0ABT7AHP5_9HYPH|nr:MlaD family protein [Chelatococcus sp. SYSU_G07232]MDJ1158497.1 MlaD family protein [Chelatococcus sp. SYSU_G07232]
METRANYALIGLFTLAVLTGAFLFVYWFAGREAGAYRAAYRIVFSGSVSGLSRGSLVLFNGIRVGEVTAIELLPEDPRRVVARVDVDSATPINVDTKARLEYQGLTGVASIAMTGGDPGAAPLVAAPGQPLPTIFADRSDFQDLLETVRRLAGRADDILTKVDRVAGDIEGPIGRTARNAETFTKALADNAPKVDRLLGNAGDLAEKLEGLSTSLDSVVKAVEPQRVSRIVENADRFMNALGASSGEVETTMKEIASISQKLNKAADKVEGVLTAAEGFLSSPDGKGAFQEIAEAARSIRTLADNLDKRTGEITAGITRFTGPGLRDYEALASDGRKTLGEINRALRSLERNPQQLIFGSKPSLPEYGGRR